MFLNALEERLLGALVDILLEHLKIFDHYLESGAIRCLPGIFCGVGGLPVSIRRDFSSSSVGGVTGDIAIEDTSLPLKIILYQD